MKKSRKVLMMVSILFMAVLWAFIVLEKDNVDFGILEWFILVFIIAMGAVFIYTAYKKDKEDKEGIPADDEMSMLIKYESGYYAYIASMYMWLFIFLFKDKFPSIESMLGGGILMAALISFLAKQYVKKQFYEK